VKSGYIEATKSRIAIVPASPQYQPMLARVLCAAVNGIEAFPIEMEVNSGWGNAIVVRIMSLSPVSKLLLLAPEKPPR
jgi:hypothetical protein